MTTGWVVMKIVPLKLCSHWIFDFYTRIPYIPKLISSVKWNQGCRRAGSFGWRPQRRLIRSQTWLVYRKRLESDLCCLHSFPELRVTSNKQIKTWTIIWDRWKAEGLNWRNPPSPQFLNVSVCLWIIFHFFFTFLHTAGPLQASARPLFKPKFICSMQWSAGAGKDGGGGGGVLWAGQEQTQQTD